MASFLKNQANQLLEDSTEFIEHKRNHGGICLETSNMAQIYQQQTKRNATSQEPKDQSSIQQAACRT